MSGVQERYHFDEAEDRLIIERYQDVEPIMDHLAHIKQVSDGRGENMYYAGTIPDVIVEQYMKEAGVTYQEIINDNTHIHRILNNPDYKKFRVWEGRV